MVSYIHCPYFDARDTCRFIVRKHINVDDILYRYFMGQLCEIAEVFYKLNNLTVRILESKNDNPGSTASPLLDAKLVFVKYRLDFDNRDYVSSKLRIRWLWKNALYLWRLIKDVLFKTELDVAFVEMADNKKRTLGFYKIALELNQASHILK